jgi:hypothetical protein
VSTPDTPGATARLRALELERIRLRWDAGAYTAGEALERAAALGAEFERLDAMHRACAEYSAARAERERLSSRPPPK